MPPRLNSSPPPSPRSSFQHAPVLERGEASGTEPVPLENLTTSGQTRRMYSGGAALVHLTGKKTEQTPETRALEADMRTAGVSLASLNALLPEGAKYSPVAAYGHPVATPSDVAGIITFATPRGESRNTTMLSVVKDTVHTNGTAEELYFIKGIRNRLVGAPQMKDLLAVRGNKSFRALLLEASADATLYARTRPLESDRPVMRIPSNARPLKAPERWSNAAQLLHKVGPVVKLPDAHAPDTTRDSAFNLGYMDYQPSQNTLVFYVTDMERGHLEGQPTERRKDKDVPVSRNLGGEIEALLNGVKSVELIAPKGKEAGVKMASFRLPWKDPDGNKVLRITFEDNAVFELTHTSVGIRLGRILPRAGAGDPMAPLSADHADISLFSYNGRSTGAYGSLDGYAFPQLVLSNGDAMPAATLSRNPTSYRAMGKALAKSLTELATLTPAFGNNPGFTATVFNTLLQAAGTALSAAVSASGHEHLRGDGTLVPGAQVFSASGAGTVQPGNLAGAIAVIVVLQNMMTKLFNSAYDNLLPQSLKSRETVKGQIFNELMLPFFGEVVRLLANYGIEKFTGVPRGNHKDALMLFATAAASTLIRAMRARTGDPVNHPGRDVMGHIIEVLFAEFLPRGFGAMIGNPNSRGINAKDLAEAIVARIVTRGYDKLLAPIFAIGCNAIGWAGLNAGAYDDELNRENSQNGILGSVQSLSHNVTVKTDKLLDSVWHYVTENTRFPSAVVHAGHRLKGNTHRATENIGVGSADGGGDELNAVEEAITFYDMNRDEQTAYLNKLSTHIKERVAQSGGDEYHPGAIRNDVGELPPKMQQGTISLLKRREEALATNPADPHYPVKPSADILGPAIPFDGRVSSVPGMHSSRMGEDMTTFTHEPVKFIGPTHAVMASGPGMPIPGSRLVRMARDVGLVPLDPPVQRSIERAVEKYSKESGPFHLLHRYDDTGQPHFTTIVPGIGVVTIVMNERGNVDGDPDRQVTGLDAMMINLGALHGAQYPGMLSRAVVTEASYMQPDENGPRNSLKAGDLVALTELFSTTATQMLAAAFLAPQGFNAAPLERRLRIVIDGDGHDPVATSISDLTDLEQVEALFPIGTLFEIAGVVKHPAKPDPDVDSLGQVVHLKRTNMWQCEDRYRMLADLAAGIGSGIRNHVTMGENKKLVLEVGDLRLEDGALLMDPFSGKFFKFNARRCTDPDFHPTKSYFLGGALEEVKHARGRTRFPLTSDTTPRGLKDDINMRLFSGHAAVKYMNDTTKNTSYEIDRRAAGYYSALPDPKDLSPEAAKQRRMVRYREEDAASLETMKVHARAVTARLKGVDIDHVLPVPTAAEQARQLTFRGHFLAQVATNALRQPLQFVSVDDTGKVVYHNGQPVVKADLAGTYDTVDLSDEPGGALMLGEGKHGYYVIQERGGIKKAVPVRISGSGHTPGNLLHAIIASSDQPAARRYAFKDVLTEVVDDATVAAEEAMPEVPGAFPETEEAIVAPQPVAKTIGALLEKLKNYADADYVPMQHWIATFDGYRAPTGRLGITPAPDVASGSGQTVHDQDPITVLPPRI